MIDKDLISFEIPSALLQKIDEQAAKERRTRSAMLRIIIAKHFEESDGK